MELLYGGGFRISEVVQLQWRDIDLRNAVVRVLGKGNKERICPVGQLCIHTLNQYRSVATEIGNLSSFVFPGKKEGHLNARIVQSRLKGYFAACGSTFRYYSAQTPPLLCNPFVGCGCRY